MLEITYQIELTREDVDFLLIALAGWGERSPIALIREKIINQVATSIVKETTKDAPSY